MSLDGSVEIDMGRHSIACTTWPIDREHYDCRDDDRQGNVKAQNPPVQPNRVSNERVSSNSERSGLGSRGRKAAGPCVPVQYAPSRSVIEALGSESPHRIPTVGPAIAGPPPRSTSSLR